MRGVNWPIIIPRHFLYTMHIEIATLVCSKDVWAEFLCEKMRVSLFFLSKTSVLSVTFII